MYFLFLAIIPSMQFYNKYRSTSIVSCTFDCQSITSEACQLTCLREMISDCVQVLITVKSFRAFTPRVNISLHAACFTTRSADFLSFQSRLNVLTGAAHLCQDSYLSPAVSGTCQSQARSTALCHFRIKHVALLAAQLQLLGNPTKSTRKVCVFKL